MILTDLTRLVSDKGLGELHAFAKKIDLAPRWFREGGEFPYYVLLGTKAQEAYKAGARLTAERNLERRAARK